MGVTLSQLRHVGKELLKLACKNLAWAKSTNTAVYIVTTCIYDGKLFAQLGDGGLYSVSMTSTIEPILDDSIRPQDDFFEYVNRKWLDKNPMPGTQPRWGVFDILRDQSSRHVREIYESLQSKKDLSQAEQQARDFYYTGINFDQLSEQHWQAVRGYMDKIADVQDTKQLSSIIGELHRIGVNAPWAMVIDTDEKDSKRYIVRLYQAGLSLPSRDHYLSNDKDMQELQNKYRVFLGKVYELAGFDSVTREEFVKTIFDIEKGLAEVQLSSSDLRDVEGNYNPITFTDLKKEYPSIDWDKYAQSANWGSKKNITHDQPNFMKHIDGMFATLSLQQWQVYLQWQLLRKFLPYISKQTSEANFDFYGKVISGTKESMPVWQRTVITIDRLMGENVGKLYAEEYFPEESKARVLKIVEEVVDAFAKRVEHLDWMGQDTKDYALKKLRNIIVLIGYPDAGEWKDYGGLLISRESFVENIINGEAFHHDFELSRLDEPKKRDEWHMPPQTVNAYHDPNCLVIGFPAGILQPPFFNPKASDAQNFGGVGTVVGHELTHAFDDQGSQFDADGNVNLWQTSAERKLFADRTKIIEQQADSFEVLPGLKLKGDLIIGEAIADLGGLELVLDALRTHHKGNAPAKDIRDLFISYAFTEAHNARDEWVRSVTSSDPHPPSEFRVNEILQHVDGFYKAFDVKVGDKLYRPPEERAKIW